MRGPDRRGSGHVSFPVLGVGALGPKIGEEVLP